MYQYQGKNITENKFKILRSQGVKTQKEINQELLQSRVEHNNLMLKIYNEKR